MGRNKIKILLADDELFWREAFFKYWKRFFEPDYKIEITECEFSEKAVRELRKSTDSKNYFDIVVADINFSENDIHESSTAGFEIIELAKKIYPRTKVIWYSAQSQETETLDRFLKESKLLKEGFIDFQIKKAWIVQSFKSEMDKCLKLIDYETNGLLFPLSQLFETYNYASNENDGFYKLTHSNFSWSEMKSILPHVLDVYSKLNIENLLNEDNSSRIEMYLESIITKEPTIVEMDRLKSRFRFEFSPNCLNGFQRSLLLKGVECKNNFSFDYPLRIYAENDRISRGFETIYENIAQHNFKTNSNSKYTISHFNHFENYLSIEIISNGNGFDPVEKFKSRRSGGLSAIYDCFKYYCQLTYESNNIGYDIYKDQSFHSDFLNGTKLTLRFLLPEVINFKIKDNLQDG